MVETLGYFDRKTITNVKAQSILDAIRIIFCFGWKQVNFFKCLFPYTNRRVSGWCNIMYKYSQQKQERDSNLRIGLLTEFVLVKLILTAV